MNLIDPLKNLSSGEAQLLQFACDSLGLICLQDSFAFTLEDLRRLRGFLPSGALREKIKSVLFATEYEIFMPPSSISKEEAGIQFGKFLEEHPELRRFLEKMK